ncbi:hypothetical protein F5Y09DRAFT_321808 [Xylaria sp. FL1042]|nr:hypothetical protein F5Y09DRAFT_321808 [Xylaria sp. FL1042]
MRLYQETQISHEESILPNLANLNIDTKCDALNGVTKPIDYHFLENFHRTNMRHGKQIHGMMGCKDSHVEQYHTEGEVWWPSIVVRLSELWDVMKEWDWTVNSPSSIRRDYYRQFFGVLSSCSLAKFQDYFILIDRKVHNEHTRDHDCVGRTSKSNRRCETHAKSYDIMGKGVSDLVHASAEDFDEEQQIWASKVEKVFGAWNLTFKTKRLQPYFVRWKTEMELERETQVNWQPYGGTPRLGGSELLYQSPVNYHFSLGPGGHTGM